MKAMRLYAPRDMRLDDVPMPEALRAAARAERFDVRRTKLEMFGVCDACAKRGRKGSVTKR